MSTEENKRNVIRWRVEIWNKRNLNIVDELAIPDYIYHQAGKAEPVLGREVLKGLFGVHQAAFDIQVTPEFLIAERGMIVVRDALLLKHTGAFQGHLPTQQEVRLTSTDIYRIVDGRFVEQWFEADLTGMLHQLGLLETVERSGAINAKPAKSGSTATRSPGATPNVARHCLQSRR